MKTHSATNILFLVYISSTFNDMSKANLTIPRYGLSLFIRVKHYKDNKSKKQSRNTRLVTNCL